VVDLMAARWRLPAGVLLIGLGLTWLAAISPFARPAPLFDGVFIEDPYLFVDPPPGAPGDPTSAEATQPVVDGSVPLLAVATTEVPPQAQIIAEADAFAISAGTESVTVTIVPAAVNDPTIAGNVYRFNVTDPGGASLQIRPGARVTIVVRAPQPNPRAQIARLDGTRWLPIPTESGGLPDLFAANITQLGDFAVVLIGTPASGSAAATVPGQSSSPTPSGGGGNGSGQGGLPVWVIVLLLIAAVGGGLAWGLLGDRDRG
jgi:hypothetical protein